MKDMERVGLQKLAEIHEPAALISGGSEFVRAHDHVHRLRGGEVMAQGTDAAQTLNDDRDVPEHLALNEALEAPEFNNMKARLLDFSGFIQPDSHFAMSFDPCDWIDHYLASLSCGIWLISGGGHA